MPFPNFHKRNPVNPDKVIGSKWTSVEPRHGWRHFRVVGRVRNPQTRALDVELMAACDREVRFWIPLRELRERSLWQASWVPLGNGEGDGAGGGEGSLSQRG